MTNDADGDDDFTRLRRDRDEVTEKIHAAVRSDPDRARGYQRAEEMRAWCQSQLGRYADDKEDILLAASEERGEGPAALTELAGGVTRQLTSRMIGNARTRRGAGRGEETA